jgi:UDPglucose--hexose-1-phosphate uridylyltransferase
LERDRGFDAGRFMGELRQDRTTGAWVIVAPRRGNRPLDAAVTPSGADRAVANARACPFCPGNEAELPPILLEIPAAAAPGWSVRVVPNKFAALGPTTDGETIHDSGHTVRPVYGFQEVVIESPRHDADLSTMTDAEVETVVSVYSRRTKHLLGEDRIETVVLFRNRGPGSGASLAHPHSQLIALDLLPQRMERIAQWSSRYLKENGICPTCQEIAIERKTGTRVIEETRCHLAIVPFAAERPCEILIAPKSHQASFTDANEMELSDLAHLLRRSLGRLRRACGDPAYNFVIESAAKRDLGSPSLHWGLRIMPDLVTWGGFEIGSGIPINPSCPESDAAFLRTDPG